MITVCGPAEALIMVQVLPIMQEHAYFPDVLCSNHGNAATIVSLSIFGHVNTAE